MNGRRYENALAEAGRLREDRFIHMMADFLVEQTVGLFVDLDEQIIPDLPEGCHLGRLV